MKRIVVAVCALVLLLNCLASLARAQSLATGVRAYRMKHEAEILKEFAELLSIPNIASDTKNIRANAEKLIVMMSRRGIEAKLLEGNGPPAVFGEIKAPGASTTVGIYAHYDGQPVDASTWKFDPFTPTLTSGRIEDGAKQIPFPKPGQTVDTESRIYARSASDDKAPIIAMLVALDALKSIGKSPAVNLKFFFEGEEEAGSRHLEEMVNRNARLLKADVWLCADGPVHQSGRNLIYFGARGIVTATITVYGASRALHSGHYGNWAPNPAMRLAKLLASMKDDNGRVLVEGFYDDVVPLGEEEKRALIEMSQIDNDLKRELAIAATEGSGRSLAELINEPSLNVDGIRSEDVGDRARTIIPAVATATVDLRLVKGIDPRRQMERLVAHIKKQGYVVVGDEPDLQTRLKHSMIARVVSNDGYPAVRTPMNLPVAKKIVRAIEEWTGEKSVLAPTLGGSVPLYIFERATGAPQIGVPTVNHDNNQHSSNENLRIKNLWSGIEVFAALMTMN